jgi:hypothetical protein
LASIQTQYSGRLDPDYRLGGGGTAGLLWDVTTNWRVQLQGDYMNFALGHRSNYHKVAVVQRYAIGRDFDVRLDIGQLNGRSDWSAAINRYF